MKIGFGAAIVIGAAFLASCATPAPKPAATTHVLFKTNWTAVKINGEDVPLNNTISLDFGDHRITGTGGCNRYFGAYDESEPALTISGLGATKMACAGPIMAREQAYLSILSAAARFAETDRGALEITARDGRAITLMPAGS